MQVRQQCKVLRSLLGVIGKAHLSSLLRILPKVGPGDLRMPGAGGGPGQRLLSAPENFPEGIHCWDHKHWRTIDPAPFIWAALPAPHPGLWSVHSESQMHAWAAATDLVGRVCWPGRAPSPCRTLSLAWLAVRGSSGQRRSPLLLEPALSGPVGVSKGLREGRWGTAGRGEGLRCRVGGSGGQAKASCQDRADLLSWAGPFRFRPPSPRCGAGCSGPPRSSGTSFSW